MTLDYKPSFLDRAVCAVAPVAGMKRMAAQRVLHQYRYDGAGASTKRASAPHNMSPNSFDVQRDRLQLMREAEDMERNFAPAKMLNRKVATYCSPISYHAQTGDNSLNKDVEAYLAEFVFPLCDVTQRYNFFKMMEFGIMGCNRGGDYGWAFMRPGLEEGMSEEDAIQLDLRIQAVEPDRIGGIYQNVVSNDYVSGCMIGQYGEIENFRVFHRSMTTNMYDSPVDIPAAQFVHMTDPMRIDQYRGVSVLATAIQNLRDLYEMIDLVKGKMKLASALTVFTNSNGAVAGSGAMDAYSAVIQPGGSASLQQDIAFGQINHLAGGTDIKFPASASPSGEEQWMQIQLLKFVAMSYNLPYSFALDAAALGGVSSRLESEMAKAEFERVQGVIAPHAHRIKDAFLYDAIAKGIFPSRVYRTITKGRWGYRAHPQPDLGKEASAAVNLNQNGLLNPLKHWIDEAQDPEDVAEDMCRWAAIKRDSAAKYGFEVTDVFGSGPAKPLSTTESKTESTSTDKQFSRKEFKNSSPLTDAINDAKDSPEWKANDANIKQKTDAIDALRADIANDIDAEANRIRVDKLRKEVSALYDNRSQIVYDYIQRREGNRAAKESVTPEQKAVKAKKRDDRHALVQALLAQGYPDDQAYAISYDIVESGKFQQSRLPADIQKKYFP